jgi:aspartate/methionine/tyrosine aminotransferase
MEGNTDMVYEPSQRIAGFKPYFFAALSQRLVELKAKGVDIIRIDMGSPDLPPADFIVEQLHQAAKRSDTPPTGARPLLNAPRPSITAGALAWRSIPTRKPSR